MENNNLEFLDVLTIISFTLQVQSYQALQKQATNNEVIEGIHNDIMRLDQKLDKIIELLNK